MADEYKKNVKDKYVDKKNYDTNKKRSVRDYVYGRPLRNYLYGRLDGELAKEDEKRKTILQRIGYNFRNGIKDFWWPTDDDKKRLMRKNIGAVDKYYLLGSPGYILPSEAVKLMYSNDPEVRKLQRKTVITSLRAYKDNDPDDEFGWGAMMRKALQDETDKPLDEVCKKGVPKYIYEPNVRYKRIENPDYKRYRNYSMAGIITGTGLLATGLASFNYALAYAGAALTLASFGYRSGHWIRTRKEDQIFEKLPSSLSELEKKVKRPVQKTVVEAPKDKGLYQSLKHWITDYMFKKSPGVEEKVKEPKDDALYVKRLYQVVPPRYIRPGDVEGWRRLPFHYTNTDTFKNPLLSGWGWLGAGSTALCLAIAGLVDANSAVTAAQSLAAAGSIGLATLGHYAGYLFGGKVAEYRKV